ncbi:iron uptake transporter deferrochelatase/peroxidase subunit [Moraxella catarrhalis]|uniref:iron uptake transporter deferrochelatase/peroxidase subunit n=1 Tax=Moraxella catarrhalis TaxID=480 RepID=UPI0007F4BBC0|nr:iron uptake transporter deferrochelatase/peroxidase subunit [Moraxella catarrhalis]MPW63351.1 deferrochelatase/peroxidase EfeB [Moraxella catarrhalis]OAV15096.1 Ferrous iron transport peroxidase EfeB [Moraxella catarrhalis]OAV17399.1 Ferrous iron transport peroxidase EfeB [Moraxella catarrhalis]RKM33613.1 deferrochelatase/peroxidase EfeB [Moraxella catarrhalis]
MTIKQPINRRQFLTKVGVGSVAVGIGTIGLAGCQQGHESKSDGQTDHTPKPDSPPNPKQAGEQNTNVKHCLADNQYDFYGKHQAGIITPAQRSIYFLVLDLHTDKLDDIKEVFKQWTQYAARLTKGDNIAPYGSNPHVPPVDTGEADSLGAYGLTLTFGVSPSFLQKLNLTDKKPPEFSDLPKFPRDQIRPEYSGGDICIQACSDDPQVSFHAVRQLVRQARSSVSMRWSQSGFLGFDSGNQTARNLFAFKDGTANSNTLDNADKHVWIQQPDWLKDGTYLVVRRIQMHLETWDRTSLNGQDETFGRHRDSGAPIGQSDEFAHLDITAKDDEGNFIIPEISHAGLAKRSGLQLLRRSYSYASGIDPKTGQFDAGLLFISFQKSPMQFTAIQSSLGRVDKMNEYITHIGSGLFACFGGVKQGEYLGQKLFE